MSAVRMRWGIKIPLRDGVHLNATLYLPGDHQVPSPAIVTLTPYVAQRYHDEAVYCAGNGYPFLAVDVRGRGNSEGEFRPLINEARDGFDTVEWLAQQPWCNGQVAMWGGSYGGYVQWVTATQRPPHLVTIAPAASPYIGVDFPMRSNISPAYLMQWLTHVSGRTSQINIMTDGGFWHAQFRNWFESGAPFKDLDKVLGNPSPTFQEWIAHPQFDDYWDRHNPTAEQYAALSIPILTITGSYDDDQPGALRHYREHLKHASTKGRSQHYLVIGPWDHAGTLRPRSEFLGLKAGPASLVDLRKLHLDWYAWTMGVAPRPEFLQKNVAYYVMGAEKWRYADSLEAITAHSRSLYLHPDTLTAEPPAASDPDRYVYDPCDVSLAGLESSLDPESRTDETLLHASPGRQLIYRSAPFEEDVQISGFFTLSVWLAIDQPDTDFRVSVWEVNLEGSAILLSADAIRARYREGLREAKLVGTTQPLRYDFEGFTFISRQIGKGHRLRLVVGPVNSIHSQKNYNSGGIVSEESVQDARPVNVSLFHDASHPSVLKLPIGRLEHG